jgi:hypothetical protein
MHLKRPSLDQPHDYHSDTAKYYSPVASNTMTSTQQYSINNHNSPAAVTSCEVAASQLHGHDFWKSSTSPSAHEVPNQNPGGIQSTSPPSLEGGISPSTCSSAVPSTHNIPTTATATPQSTQASSSRAAVEPHQKLLAVDAESSWKAALAAAPGSTMPVVNLPVVCGPMIGILQVHRGRVVLDANTPEQTEVSTTEFERRGGRGSTKKWRQSLRLLLPDGMSTMGMLLQRSSGALLW